MKNKISKNFFLIIIFLSFFLKDSYSKDLEFTATKLEILENGNLLVGEGGVKVISDDQTLEADKFKYNKIDLHLELVGNVVAINSSDDTVITGNKIDYFKNQEKFISTGDVEIKISDKYTINSSNLTYFKIKEHFFSKDQTVFKDKIGNKFELKNFNYLKLKNEIKGKKIKYTDIQLNEYFIEDAMVNLESNEIIGKDLKIDFTNLSVANPGDVVSSVFLIFGMNTGFLTVLAISIMVMTFVILKFTNLNGIVKGFVFFFSALLLIFTALSRFTDLTPSSFEVLLYFLYQLGITIGILLGTIRKIKPRTLDLK